MCFKLFFKINILRNNLWDINAFSFIIEIVRFTRSCTKSSRDLYGEFTMAHVTFKNSYMYIQIAICDESLFCFTICITLFIGIQYSL